MISVLRGLFLNLRNGGVFARVGPAEVLALRHQLEVLQRTRRRGSEPLALLPI